MPTHSEPNRAEPLGVVLSRNPERIPRIQIASLRSQLESR
jgi:hypothetical protein